MKVVWLLTGVLSILVHVSTARAVALIEPESLLRLSEYDRNYLLLGRPDNKIQMSVKEQPIDDIALYVSYTQMMFWQIVKNQGPFSEVNFNPSIFYRWNRAPEDFFTAIDFGLFDHKSNGQGEPTRRSYNDRFVEFHADHAIGCGSLLSTTRLYLLYALDDENSDLRNYFGFWQTSLSYLVHDRTFFKLFEFYMTLHPGNRFGYDLAHGSQELGIRMKFSESRSLPYLYIQYFNGYIEGLATYDRSTSSLRVGFQL